MAVIELQPVTGSEAVQCAVCEHEVSPAQESQHPAVGSAGAPLILKL
jgi:hypothetical protein